MKPRVSWEELVETIRRYVRDNYPGRIPVRVRIKLDNSDELRSPISPRQDGDDRGGNET